MYICVGKTHKACISWTNKNLHFQKKKLLPTVSFIPKNDSPLLWMLTRVMHKKAKYDYLTTHLDGHIWGAVFFCRKAFGSSLFVHFILMACINCPPGREAILKLKLFIDVKLRTSNPYLSHKTGFSGRPVWQRCLWFHFFTAEQNSAGWRMHGEGAATVSLAVWKGFRQPQPRSALGWGGSQVGEKAFVNHNHKVRLVGGAVRWGKLVDT